MEKKPMLDEAAERETCIGKGCDLEGKIAVSGNLRIDGKVRGHVQVEGQLIIGQGAQVTADITAGILRVEGEANGELKATSQIALAPTARVKGSLESPALSIERGALFEGTCKMTMDKPNLVPLPQPQPARANGARSA